MAERWCGRKAERWCGRKTGQKGEEAIWSTGLKRGLDIRYSGLITSLILLGI